MIDSHDIRSRTLNYAIITELLLVDFIREYFVKEVNKAKEFKDFILDKEFFTFAQKIRLFEKILKQFKFLNLKDFNSNLSVKDFIKKIDYIREVRNAIAHNHQFTKKETGEPYVQYVYENKKKELILNETFDKEFFKDYCEVSDILRNMIKIARNL